MPEVVRLGPQIGSTLDWIHELGRLPLDPQISLVDEIVKAANKTGLGYLDVVEASDFPKEVTKGPPGGFSQLPIRQGGGFLGYHGTMEENRLKDILNALMEGRMSASGGFHLGTKQAAIDRLRDVAGETYKEYDEIPDAKILKVKGPLGRSIGPVTDKVANRILTTSRGRSMLQELGIDSVIYKNAVEDKGSTSVALVNKIRKKSPFQLMDVRKFVFGLLLAALLGGAFGSQGESNA